MASCMRGTMCVSGRGKSRRDGKVAVAFLIWAGTAKKKRVKERWRLEYRADSGQQ